MADNYEFFYDGGSSSLDPESSEFFIGYRFPASRLGASTSIQTAEQVREVSARLSEGMKIVEMGTMDPKIFESIPKQHLQEINRLSKLTGSEVSMHAPMIDPAGFTEQGWDETSREIAERQLWNVVERSHELNPKGNVPVTIHASAMPAAEFRITPEKKEEKEMIVAINQETGKAVAAKREEVFYPEEGVRTISPNEQIRMMNNTEWMNTMRPAVDYEKEANALLSQAWPIISPKYEQIITGQIKEESLQPIEQDALRKLRNADIFLRSAHSVVNTLYDHAYQYGSEKEKKLLSNLTEKFKEDLKKVKNPSDYVTALGRLTQFVQRLPPPEIYKPLEEFALEHSSETLSNVAFKAYKKFKDNAPLINIENVFPGMAFSRADKLKKLIEASREEFVKKAIKEGYSSDEAKETAKKLIGATWDVGHINLLRKSGFSKEQIIGETKKIAPYVKHLHLTDNFGFDDSHLPVGMGEVPVKEMMKELEKAGYSGKAIMEAGGFAVNFKVSPHPYALEALGSPLYSAYMQPFWNQMRGTAGTYSAGYGLMLPEQHFSMYGSGFSTLPTEVGGQVSGRSRFAGTPTE